jgi:hypothetical protein
LTWFSQRAGFAQARARPRTVQTDGESLELAEAITRRTLAAKVAVTRDAALRAERIEPARFDTGIHALHRAAGIDGAFCYTFFKAVALR